MFTVFSVVNTAPTLMITVIALLIYAFSKNLTSDRLIGIYLAVNYIATFGICGWFFKSTRGVKSGKLFSRENIETTKVGFLITVGNYISLLFHAVDKQFVKIFFTDYDFAMYSFSVSTQTIMTVFITALAQPFYPKMANNTIKNEEYNIMKELLFLFGSMSGVAYFAISFIVKHFIPNYVDSIKIVAMFFAVFPAMAVINVIYINMYKITKQMKKYISTLSLMLVLAVVFNYAAVLLKGSYVGIALATMLVYYFWLFYSAKDFEYINIGKKDIVYLLGYFAAYFICTRMLGEIAGIIIYASFMLLWGRLLYGKSMSYLLDIIRNKVHV